MQTESEPASSSEEQPNTQRWMRFWEHTRYLLGIPLLLLGCLLSFGFLFCVVDSVIGRFKGGHPNSIIIGLFFLWVVFGGIPLAGAILLLPAKKGFIKYWLSRLFFGALLVFLALGADINFGPKNWHSIFRTEKKLEANTELLRASVITAHTVFPINSGTNVIWCGSFQLCWDALRKMLGENIRLDQNPPLAAALNQDNFGADCIDKGSYVALAGTVGDHIFEKIQTAVAQKFGKEFQPHLIPPKKMVPRPQDIVAYACLYKNLSFPVAFESFDDRFHFNGSSVRAFGMKDYKESHDKMYPQVLIRDYQSADDFVIELKSKEAGDQIILAKTTPQQTLMGTITNVQERIAHKEPQAMTKRDMLLVPRFNFDLTRRYTEIEGRRLITTNKAIDKDLELLSAMQNIRFTMNEKGAELRSEGHMAFGCAKEEGGPHIMFFNKPFLLILKKAKANFPYFAMWVENAELMVSW